MSTVVKIKVDHRFVCDLWAVFVDQNHNRIEFGHDAEDVIARMWVQFYIEIAKKYGATASLRTGVHGDDYNLTFETQDEAVFFSLKHL